MLMVPNSNLELTHRFNALKYKIFLFRNENYKELETSHLKYFLLPVLLADLNSRLNLSPVCTLHKKDPPPPPKKNI